MNSEQQLVLDAVRQKSVTGKDGFLQKLFAVWFDAFVYNQIWEDPRVDLEALRLDENSRVLTISSGGCNALNYLLESPESVTAVDLNKYHIFLLNLKIAALEYLPNYEDFFAFFGCGKSENAVALYEKFIAPNLEKQTKHFWESNGFFGGLFYGNRIGYFKRGGLYAHSRNGYFLRLLRRFARLSGCKPDEILKAKTFAEQENLYQKYINPFFDSSVIKIVGKLPVTMFGLGIPPQQYAELKRNLTGGESIIDIYRTRAHKLACAYPIRENYFAWQAFAGKYDCTNRRAVPEYLKAENYEALKARVYRLKTKIGSITEEIENQPKNAFNRFVFLDAQDWMNREALTDLWRTIAEKAEKDSRIIFRTASGLSRVETDLPKSLRRKFYYEKEISKELFERDRASIYGGFHLYILK